MLYVLQEHHIAFTMCIDMHLLTSFFMYLGLYLSSDVSDHGKRKRRLFSDPYFDYPPKRRSTRVSGENDAC